MSYWIHSSIGVSDRYWCVLGLGKGWTGGGLRSKGTVCYRIGVWSWT